MLRGHEYDWLNARFGPFDPVYIDPLVCELAALRPWSALSPSADSAAHAARAFAWNLAAALGVDSSSAWDCNSVTASELSGRLQKDRGYRRRAQLAINEHVSALKAQHTKTVAAAQRMGLDKLADKPSFGSLVAVEAILTDFTGLSESVRQAVCTQVGLPEWKGWQRSVQALLTDVPAPMLGPRHAMLPLVMDSEALQSLPGCLGTALTIGGWYPYARAIGLCSASPGTKPYLDVLVLMMRPLPPSDELFCPRQPQRHTLPGMLDSVRKHLLDPSAAQRSTSRSPGASPARNTIGRGSELLPNDDTGLDRVLTPVYLFKLCCQLNYLSGSELRWRAPAAYGALEAYLASLRGLIATIGIENGSGESDSRFDTPEEFLQRNDLATAEDLPKLLTDATAAAGSADAEPNSRSQERQSVGLATSPQVATTTTG